MKTQCLQFIVTILALLLFPKPNTAQTPDLGTAANFVLFTKTGAVGNTGISQISGNVGTNNGAITGFESPTTMDGYIDSGNIATMKCIADLQAAYDELFSTAPTSASHTPAFGSGETLFAGVYSIAAAGSVAGSLTLDAQGNANAVFIFKFGGAFTTGASTTINLINDASACNVFWVAEGAIAMAASTSMKGTLIANNGAISMGAGGILEGRMLSTTGAASIYQVTASAPCASVSLPVEFFSFTGTCNRQNIDLRWATATETDNQYFTVERSSNGIIWQVVGKVAGSYNSFSRSTYTLTDKTPERENSLYRLKQTDFNGNFKYGKVIVIKKCKEDAADNISIYPNPSTGKFELLLPGKMDQVHSIQIFNSHGQKSYESNGFQSNFNLTVPGVYFIRIQLDSEMINLKIMIDR